MSRCRAEMHNQVFVLSIILDKSCTLNVEHLYMCHSQNKKMKTDDKRPGMLAMCVMNEKSYHGWWYFFFTIRVGTDADNKIHTHTKINKNKQKLFAVILLSRYFSLHLKEGVILLLHPLEYTTFVFLTNVTYGGDIALQYNTLIEMLSERQNYL